jgi:hypothetical protein
MGLEKIGLQGVFETAAFASGLKTYTGGIDKATGQTEKAASAISGELGGALLSGITQYLSFAAAIGLATKVMSDSIKAAAEEETNLASLNATIQSMGLSSEVTAVGIRSLAENMQAANGIFAHDDLEKAAQALLRIEGFDSKKLESSLKTIEDYAAGTGQGVEEAGQQIAQALETGMVRSLGFSAALRTQVTTMISAGDKAGALALIMDTLNSKYGGQAAAALNTYNGKMEVLKNTWGEFLAVVGTGMLPGGKGLLDILNTATISATQLLQIWSASHYNIVGLIQVLNKVPTIQYGPTLEELILTKDFHDELLVYGPTLAELTKVTDFAAAATKRFTDQVSWEISFTDRATTSDQRRADLIRELGGLHAWEADKINDVKDKLAALDAEAQKQKDTDIWNFVSQGLQNLNPELLPEIALALGLVSEDAAKAYANLFLMKRELESLPYKTELQVVLDIIGKYFPPDEQPEVVVPMGTGKAPPYMGGNSASDQAWRDFWNGIGPKPAGWARGGSFIVPPGFPNDSFPMRVQSGERVTVTPAGGGGVVNNNNSRSSNPTINVYNPSAEPASASIPSAMIRLNYLGVI